MYSMTGDAQMLNLLGISGPSRKPQKDMYFTRARITVCIAMGSQKKYLEALYMVEREEINLADP